MFYYYGAKHTTAAHYPPPRYDTVVEPFRRAGRIRHMHHLLRGNIRRLVLVEKDPRRGRAAWRRLLDDDVPKKSAAPSPFPSRATRLTISS